MKYQIQKLSKKSRVRNMQSTDPLKLQSTDRCVIAEGGGMSSEWFTELEILKGEPKVKILGHYRLFWDEHDYWPEANKNAKHNNLSGKIREGEGRIVTHYTIRNRKSDLTTIYEVINPQHIFSYPDRH